VPIPSFMRFRLPVMTLPALALLFAAFGGASIAQTAPYVEAPVLEARVAAGELPPVAERLPAKPRQVMMDGENLSPGHYGGT